MNTHKHDSKILVISRTLLGVCFFLFGLNDYHQLLSTPQLGAEATNFLVAIKETGYMYQTIKIIEFGSAILLVGGFFVPLAALLVFPIILNIFLFHLFLDPVGLVLASVMLLCASYIFWYYRNMFKWLINYNLKIDPNKLDDEDIRPN